jgi:hypothetical protein
VTAYQSHSQSYQSIARSLLPFIVIDSLVQVILDGYQHFHPSNRTAISSFLSIHLVLSLITLFAWTVCCIFYYFVSLKEVQQFLDRRDRLALKILWFWYLSLAMEGIRGYHWILETTKGSF